MLATLLPNPKLADRELRRSLRAMILSVPPLERCSVSVSAPSAYALAL